MQKHGKMKNIMALQQELINLIGFVIEPQDLFSHLIQN